MREQLKQGLALAGLPADPQKIEQLLRFMALLTAYNSHTNVTAIREEGAILEKHILDSLLLQGLISGENQDNSPRRAIDIGTGAGFPGMILAIWNPHIHFTLLDSVGKKTRFLQEVKEALSLANTEIVTARAEDLIEGRRETYDFAFCRAVARLPVIIEYALPFLKTGGRFFPQKSDESEAEGAKRALSELKAEITGIRRMTLPFSQEKRVVIEIKKNAVSAKKYPRKAGTPQKNPL